MGGGDCMMKNYQAPVSMVLVQAFTTGMMVLSKIILSRGTFVFSLLAYRNAIGAICVAPLAFFFEREMGKKLSCTALLWISINALFGIPLAMGLYYYGLGDTTATYSVNFLNLIPVVTFLLSVVLRFEKLGLSSKAGRVKIIGTLFCVGGAMIISMYKGKELHLWPSLFHKNQSLVKEARAHDLTRGTMMLVGSCLSYALWFTVQVKLYKVFPSKYWATFLTCVIGCFQSVVLGVILDRREAAWRLRWDLQLLTIVYSGVLNTAATYCLISWVIAQRGPLYPPMFNPLSLIFVAIIESLFMGQDLTVGRLLGMFLIIFGLYAFLWGKKEELSSSKMNLQQQAIAGLTIAISESTQEQSIITPDPTHKHALFPSNSRSLEFDEDNEVHARKATIMKAISEIEIVEEP